MGSWLSLVALYPPTPPHYTGNEEWVLTNNDGVPYVKYDGSDTVLLVSHGNASDLGDMYVIADILNRLSGATVIAYDYSGYGTDLGGTYSFELMTENLESMLPVCQSYERVFLVGWSIGSGPTCQVAASRDDVDGVILISGFTSIAATVVGRPLGRLDAFHNHELVGEIDCPVHVIHGELDDVVPYNHSEQLHNAAKVKGVFKPVPRGDHANLFLLEDDLGPFLQQALGTCLL